jgi:hypothetical protein
VLDFQYIRSEQMKANRGNIMNTPTTLDLRRDVRSSEKTFGPVATMKNLVSLIVNAPLNGRSREASSQQASGYRLGEAVQHVQYGSGRVKALWPDGALLVRFDSEDKNRMVFPSLLQGVNGR